MFFQYFKASPDQHVVLYRDGKVKRHGRGISFYFMPAVSSLVVLPAVARDMPFVFTDATANFQDVVLQGSVVYRITAPLVTAEQFNFVVNKRVAANGEEKLNQRIVNVIHSHVRNLVAQMALEDVLKEVGDLTARVAKSVVADPAIASAGITVENLHFASARAAPDVQKALQTEYREKLQREADLAIYARRSASVENERQVKERELTTEIELSTRRKQLVDNEARNTLIIAEAKSKADEMQLAAYREIPSEVLAMLALKSWAEKGGEVANLTITPDLVSGLISKFTERKAA